MQFDSASPKNNPATENILFTHGRLNYIKSYVV